MRAVTQDRYGSSDVLQVGMVERPDIATDEVLIEVHAAGVDRGTEHLMTGKPYLIRLLGFGFRRPKQRVLGSDVAGTVIEIGSAVTRFKVGDEVFGVAEGSFAEYAAAKQEKLALKPSGVSFEAAAVTAVSGITALQALTDVGKVKPGQRVLVIGASGGVGTFAVQLARTLGATVDGVAGARNLELVRSLGAEHVYDHRQTALADITERYDLVLDIGGQNPLRSLRGVLAERGTLVIVGGEDGDRFTGGIGRQLRAMILSPFVAHRLTAFISKVHQSSIEQLAGHLASGSVIPAIAGRFDLAETAQAIRLFEIGKASGKSVINVRSA
ncbi:MAG: NAD(P)-dependent alcohol dehydrogenase [Dehalococcoidia bacterium]|nr:NAD(P)-dependent alcohol dehydrogenase [Dehalococcoidia bacterium]MCA9826597.1 NAD(P)-dependent alcohol dehydrogenase [Dehalococcoidia bacterium]MCA9846154.1 NAD(P)-dependent alcohol dehydrogenase [Dehalococcoidia bacterium]